MCAQSCTKLTSVSALQSCSAASHCRARSCQLQVLSIGLLPAYRAAGSTSIYIVIENLALHFQITKQSQEL